MGRPSLFNRYQPSVRAFLLTSGETNPVWRVVGMVWMFVEFAFSQRKRLYCTAV
jgi:hypothetical protein